MTARSMLARVVRLEQARQTVSPFVQAYGSIEAFEAEVQAGVAAGALDRRDMSGIVNCIRRWHHNQVWTIWR